MSTVFERFSEWLEHELAPVFVERELVASVPGQAWEPMEPPVCNSIVLVLRCSVECDCDDSSGACKGCDTEKKHYEAHVSYYPIGRDGVEDAYYTVSRLSHAAYKYGCKHERPATARYTECEDCEEEKASMMKKWQIEKQKENQRIETEKEARQRFYRTLSNRMAYQLEMRKKIAPELKALTEQMCDDEKVLTHMYTLLESTHGERSDKEFKQYRTSIAWLTQHIQKCYAPGAPLVQSAAASFSQGNAEQKRLSLEVAAANKSKKKRKTKE